MYEMVDDVLFIVFFGGSLNNFV